MGDTINVKMKFGGEEIENSYKDASQYLSSLMLTDRSNGKQIDELIYTFEEILNTDGEKVAGELKFTHMGVFFRFI